MKRVFMSGLMIMLSSLSMASVAMAESLPSSGQTNLQDLAADFNNDGVVTIGELVRYNRDQRQA